MLFVTCLDHGTVHLGKTTTILIGRFCKKYRDRQVGSCRKRKCIPPQPRYNAPGRTTPAHGERLPIQIRWLAMRGGSCAFQPLLLARDYNRVGWCTKAHLLPLKTIGIEVSPPRGDVIPPCRPPPPSTQSNTSELPLAPPWVIVPPPPPVVIQFSIPSSEIAPTYNAVSETMLV